MRSLILILIFLNFGCGKEPISITGQTGSDGAQGIQGLAGVQGLQGASGLSISSIMSIPRYGADPYTGAGGPNLCPGYPTTDTCSFEGGQRVTYSDGSIYLSGSFRMVRADTYSTVNEVSYSKIFPASATSGDIILTSKLYQVANNPRILFLHWERTPELVQLIVDSNQSQTVNSGDSVLQALTLF